MRQLRHESQARIAVGIFISHAPENHTRTVDVTHDEFLQLIAGIRQGFGIVKVNGPVNRDFFPKQQANFIGQLSHVFMVRVMRQAQEVTTHFFGVCQAAAYICFGGHLAHQDIILMDTDAAQKQGLPVEQ